MNITDIIGESKTFEPPFRIDSSGNYHYIRDKRGNALAEMHVQSRARFGIFESMETIANHIVELLNERWKDETMQP